MAERSESYTTTSIPEGVAYSAMSEMISFSLLNRDTLTSVWRSLDVSSLFPQGLETTLAVDHRFCIFLSSSHTSIVKARSGELKIAKS